MNDKFKVFAIKETEKKKYWRTGNTEDWGILNPAYFQKETRARSDIYWAKTRDRILHAVTELQIAE